MTRGHTFRISAKRGSLKETLTACGYGNKMKVLAKNIFDDKITVFCPYCQLRLVLRDHGIPNLLCKNPLCVREQVSLSLKDLKDQIEYRSMS